MTRGEPRLDVTLPDDLTVFTLLAALPNLPHFTLDARNEEGSGPSTRKPYYSARRSEEGRYLSGLLDLFGGLHQADDTLSTRYWRQMFDRLSGRTAATDAVFLEKVGNTLRKHLRASRAQFYTNDKAMTWLTNYVLKVARCLRRVWAAPGRAGVGPVVHGRTERISVCAVPGSVREGREGAARRSRYRGHPQRRSLLQEAEAMRVSAEYNHAKPDVAPHGMTAAGKRPR